MAGGSHLGQGARWALDLNPVYRASTGPLPLRERAVVGEGRPVPASPRWQRGPSPAARLSCDLPSPADSPELRIKPRNGGREVGLLPDLTSSTQEGRARAPNPRRTLRPKDADPNTLVREAQEARATPRLLSSRGFQCREEGGRGGPSQGSKRQQRAACSDLS